MIQDRSSTALVLLPSARLKAVDAVAEQALYGALQRGLRSGPDGIASGHAAYQSAQQRCGSAASRLDLRI